MKTIYVALALSLVSISSFACPSIKGTWTCGGSKYPQNIEMIKDSVGYNLVLTDSLEETKNFQTILVINGKDQELNNRHYMAFCRDNQVVVKSDVIYRYILVHPGALVQQELKHQDGMLVAAAKGVNCKRAYPLN